MVIMAEGDNDGKGTRTVSRSKGPPAVLCTADGRDSRQLQGAAHSPPHLVGCRCCQVPGTITTAGLNTP